MEGNKSPGHGAIIPRPLWAGKKKLSHISRLSAEARTFSLTMDGQPGTDSFLISCLLPPVEPPRLTEQACRAVCTPRSSHTTLHRAKASSETGKHNEAQSGGFNDGHLNSLSNSGTRSWPTSLEDSLADYVHREGRFLFSFK